MTYRDMADLGTKRVPSMDVPKSRAIWQ